VTTGANVRQHSRPGRASFERANALPRRLFTLLRQLGSPRHCKPESAQGPDGCKSGPPVIRTCRSWPPPLAGGGAAGAADLALAEGQRAVVPGGPGLPAPLLRSVRLMGAPVC